MLPKLHQRIIAAGGAIQFDSDVSRDNLDGLVIARSVGEPLADYLSEKIWRPYGMERDAAWRVDPMGR